MTTPTCTCTCTCTCSSLGGSAVVEGQWGSGEGGVNTC